MSYHMKITDVDRKLLRHMLLKVIMQLGCDQLMYFAKNSQWKISII